MSAETVAIIAGVALAISEGIAVIPQFESNSILQLVITILRKITGK